ncbi:MAG: hypothetical protein ACLT98_13835 [Eggerthellaceae bacterium]
MLVLLLATALTAADAGHVVCAGRPVSVPLLAGGRHRGLLFCMAGGFDRRALRRNAGLRPRPQTSRSWPFCWRWAFRAFAEGSSREPTTPGAHGRRSATFALMFRADAQQVSLAHRMLWWGHHCGVRHLGHWTYTKLVQFLSLRRFPHARTEGFVALCRP